MTRAPTPFWPEFWQLYDEGRWEPESREILARFLTPGSLFVDVGAWVGPMSMWAVGLGASVIAYEPDPVAFEMLVRNVPGIDARTSALAAYDGKGRLGNPWVLGDSRSRLTDDGMAVQTISPATLLADIEPALLKVDIEGGEIAVLPRLAPLCASRGIPLFVSWHEEWWTAAPREDERRAWFRGFSSCEGRWGDFDTLLAIP